MEGKKFRSRAAVTGSLTPVIDAAQTHPFHEPPSLTRTSSSSSLTGLSLIRLFNPFQIVS
jgi:hypothetical protein